MTDEKKKLKIGFFSNPHNPNKGFQLLQDACNNTGDEIVSCWNIPHEDTMQQLKQCDIICVPTINYPEPLSRILIEAMKHGKPSIAFDIGGNKDVIADERIGMLLPFREDESQDVLTEALVGAINKARDNLYGPQAIKAIYYLKFHPDMIAGKVQQAYKKVMRKA